jgi:hypothetical protein
MSNKNARRGQKAEALKQAIASIKYDASEE